MTLAIGLAGFFMIPDYPKLPNPGAFWLSADHAAMATVRLDRHGRSDTKRITWDSVKRTFSMWIAYFIPALYITTVLAPYGYNYFNLFLKGLKNPDGTPTWTTEEVNAIPIAGGAINIVCGESLDSCVRGCRRHADFNQSGYGQSCPMYFKQDGLLSSPKLSSD